MIGITIPNFSFYSLYGVSPGLVQTSLVLVNLAFYSLYGVYPIVTLSLPISPLDYLRRIFLFPLSGLYHCNPVDKWHRNLNSFYSLSRVSLIVTEVCFSLFWVDLSTGLLPDYRLTATTLIKVIEDFLPYVGILLVACAITVFVAIRKMRATWTLISQALSSIYCDSAPSSKSILYQYVRLALDLPSQF